MRYGFFSTPANAGEVHSAWTSKAPTALANVLVKPLMVSPRSWPGGDRRHVQSAAGRGVPVCGLGVAATVRADCYGAVAARWRVNENAVSDHDRWFARRRPAERAAPERGRALDALGARALGRASNAPGAARRIRGATQGPGAECVQGSPSLGSGSLSWAPAREPTIVVRHGIFVHPPSSRHRAVTVRAYGRSHAETAYRHPASGGALHVSPVAARPRTRRDHEGLHENVCKGRRRLARPCAVHFAGVRRRAEETVSHLRGHEHDDDRALAGHGRRADEHRELGTDTSYGMGTVTVPEYGASNQHLFRITGLQPATRYFYRVADATNGVYGTGSFRTAPDVDATSVKFLAFGDTRSGPLAMDGVIQEMRKVNAADPAYQSINIQAGDWVSSDAESSWTAQWFNSNAQTGQLLAEQHRFQVLTNSQLHRGRGRRLSGYARRGRARG